MSLGNWLEERTGYRKALDHLLDEPVRGGASWAYVFGSVLTFLLLLQAGTGILLALYYSPSVTDAWASVAYIQRHVTMGWFIRGLHSHGASAMVATAGLHMFQVALYGAYKRPREVNWLVGVMLLGLLLAFALTGYLLPWDQKGYWATKVATGIMASTPLLGDILARLVQGGSDYGNLTLTRFFTIHVLLLPGATFVLLGLHLILFRKHGVTPKWGRSETDLDRATQPFWPYQMFRDMVAIMVALLAVVLFTIWGHGVPLAAPADPASGYDARPEWYFLPLFQLLKYFEGPLEQLAALGVPLLVGAVLVGIPFLDRGNDRSPRKRSGYIATLLLGFACAAALITLSLGEDAADDGFQKRRKEADAQAQKALMLSDQGVPAAGGTALYENEPFFLAKKLWAEHCAGCHEGEERKAPTISRGYNTRSWIRGFLKDPDGAAFYGLTKAIHNMKPVEHEGEELEALVELVYAETGAADANAARAAKGKQLFESGPCIDCHSIDAHSMGDQGPNLGGRGSQKWLFEFIADPAHPRFFGEKNEMTAFEGKLSAYEVDLLAEYLISLRQNE